MGYVGVLTTTLFPLRGFNTHTFSAIFTQFCTNSSLIRSVSLAAVCLRLLQLPPLSSLSCSCFKHDTGFGTDRLTDWLFCLKSHLILQC